jgi:hypothetical protein
MAPHEFAISYGFLTLLLMVPLGRYVAWHKGRSSWEGTWLALIYGPLGVLVAALLPGNARVLAERLDAANRPPAGHDAPSRRRRAEAD